MNVAGLFSGHTETLLTPEGQRQAIAAGKKAKNFGIDFIISSPLSRAHDTAKLIAKEIGYPEDEIILSDLFNERYYGAMEGKPYNQDRTNNDFTGSESTKALLKRARKALDYLETVKADTILVVSHGAFGRALRHHILEDFPFSNYHRIPNAEIFQLL